MSDSSAPPSGTLTKSQATRSSPQKAVTEFWTKFSIEKPDKITRFLPPAAHEKFLQKEIARGPTRGNVKVSVGYEAAMRKNEKWSDPEFDLKIAESICLHGLVDYNPGAPGGYTHDLKQALRTTKSASNILNAIRRILLPAIGNVLKAKLRKQPTDRKSVHRVDWIFEKPQFTIEGFEASDVVQGRLGNCWWLVSVAAFCNVDGHMDNICVARDEECGVYGFVFFRDGEWVSTVVDDNLCLKSQDFNYGSTRDPRGTKAKKWKEDNQTGSEALLCARCKKSNETWLPLLEKAYAKIHGDYAALDMGSACQGVEDMSGGVITRIYPDDILCKERLWQDLLKANKDFVFTLSTPEAPGGGTGGLNGLPGRHSYTVLEAQDHEDENGTSIRLVRLRNPWGTRDCRGKAEWDGPWSDGSKEWTQYWIQKLKHQSGEDGVFYMAFEDMLKRFELLDRVRLFNGDGWYNSQFQSPVSWFLLFHNYYKGLQGQYIYCLGFLLRKSGSEAHIALAGERYSPLSVSAELELGSGKYEVIPRVVAHRIHDDSLVEQIGKLEKAAKSRPQKFQQVALNYDRAHLKASQWDSDSDAGFKEKQETTMVQGAAKDERSVPLTETSSEITGPNTAQPQTAEDYEVRKAQLSEDEDSDDTDESKTSPWNAVCVIGLRVFSKDANLELFLEQSCHITQDPVSTPSGNLFCR